MDKITRGTVLGAACVVILGLQGCGIAAKIDSRNQTQ
jgi:hypothetical protein